MRDGFKVQIGKDEFTPLMRSVLRSTSPGRRQHILKMILNDLKNELRDNIANEKEYDGAPMKTPSKDPRPDGKFAKSYKWRYLKSYRKPTKEEKASGRRKTKTSTTFVKGKARETEKVRGRVAVDGMSKQLNFTGETRKSIDIISVSSNRGTVGPKGGHGRKILSFHNATRRPVGISKLFAEGAQKKAARELWKGVR